MNFKQSISRYATGLTAMMIAQASMGEWKLSAPLPTHEYAQGRGSGSAPLTLQSMEASTYGTTVTTNETEVTDEIRALARALDHDPLQMYAYVKNHIEYIPTYGVYVGATGCLKAMKGNDFDQCALLASLFRVSGYECYYRNADVNYYRSDVANWLPLPAGELDGIHFNCGGDSGAVSGYPNEMFVNRTWVIAEIDGSEVVFDPAIKNYTTNNAIDLATATGYSLSSLRSAASSNATVTGYSVEDMNQTALDAILTEYTTNLIAYIKNNYSGRGVDEVYGLRKIIPENIDSYPTALPFNAYIYSSTVTNWTHIPTNDISSFRVQHQGIDESFSGHELAGKRLSIMYDTSNGNRPILYLDGTSHASGNPTTIGQEYDLTVSVDVPTSPYHAPGAYDDSATQSLKSGGEFVIVQDANTSSPKVLQDANNELSESMNAGLLNDSEAIVGGALELAAWMYRMQDSALTEIISRQCGVAGYTMYLMGVCGQNDGVYIDMPVGFGASHSPDVDKRNKYFTIRNLMGSALEHGIFEQNQDIESVSTIRVLNLNDADGKKTFLADSNTWSTVSSLLPLYDSTFKTQIGTAVANGTVFILPENPDVQYNDWEGIGYISLNRQTNGQSMLMAIEGGYNGGTGSYTGTKTSSWIGSLFSGIFGFFSAGIDFFFSFDPVELHTGYFVSETTDLVVGNEPTPLGMDFTRSYSSGQKRNDHALGYGWTHSLDMDIIEQTRSEPAQGQRTPEDAAAVMVYSMVASELMDGTPDVLDWSIGIYASDWAMKQATLNAAVVQLGKSSMEFIRQPDGSYTPPPGITHSLIKTNGLFVLEERHGLTYAFNVSNAVATITNTDDKTMIFTYADDKLSEVKDAYNRTLTFGYAGDQLTSVTDGGRTVSYQHDTSGNLTNVNDVTGFDWGIGYDGESQIKNLIDPEGIVTVQNNYNSLGQVTNQISSISTPWNYYASGFGATEEDPYGNRTTYYFDGQGRGLGMLNTQSNRTYRGFDAQGHLTTTVNEAGVTNIAVYDANHNLLIQTNALGTSEQVVNGYGYDAEHHLRFVTNAVGTVEQTVSELTYTSEHKINTVTLAKGTSSETVTDIDYYTDALKKGRLEQRSEGNGKRITTYSQYDAYGNAELVASSGMGNMTYDYDSLGNLKTATLNGKTTEYEYDDRRRVKKTTYGKGSADEVSTSRTFRDNDLLKTTTDAKGETTSYYYTDAYKQAGVVYPDTSSTTNIYDDASRLVRTVDAELNETILQLDSLGRVTNIVGETTTALAQYDVVGNPTNSVVDPSGLALQSRFTYDALNRITHNYRPIGHEEYEIDALGRTTNRVDAASKNWKTEYDELGRMKKNFRPSGNYEEYGYDDLGSRTHFWNAEFKPMYFGMDGQGRVTNITNAINNATSFDYNLSGNLSRRTAADLKVTDYGYDSLNRLTAITNESVEVAAFDHDDNGNVMSLENDNTTITLGYDSMNRLTASTQTVDTATSIVGYQYDLNGNRTHVTYPGNTNAMYDYGDDNRLDSVDLSAFGVATAITFDYDGANRLTNIVYPNSVNSAFGYDDNGQVTSIKHGDFVDKEIHRNALGFKHTETIDAGLKPLAPSTYRSIKTHNDADQLTAEIVTEGTNSYTVSYGYDANGCMTSSVSSVQSLGYEYDYDNRITSATGVEYIYDASGARVGRISGTTTNYFVIDYTDGLKRPLAEMDASGNLTRYYVWSGMRLLCHIESNGDVLYYHSDELGSTLALTDDTGSVTDEFAYMPYGYATHTAHAGSVDTPFQWLGGYGVYYDSVSDLHLTLHRAYSSKLKRFIHPDPLGIDGGVNVYAMANMNPLAFVDPYGLEPWFGGGDFGGGTDPGGVGGPGGPETGGGVISRGISYVQNALASVGSAIWSGASFVGGAAWDATTFVGGAVWAGGSYIVDVGRSIGRSVNPVAIYRFAQNASDREDTGSPTAHEHSAFGYGQYVNNKAVAQTVRTVSEFVFQFPVYTTQDLFSRAFLGGAGPYQPYMWSTENGGILDSFHDIGITGDGASAGPGATNPY